MEKDQYYLVKAELLPEAMLKAMKAQALLDSRKVKTINDALKAVDISRTAFYRYKDKVIPFRQLVKENIITLSIHLEDRSGTLSQLLSVVAHSGANVLTINQTIPLQSRATITLSIETASITVEIDELIKQLRELEAVEKVELIGSGA